MKKKLKKISLFCLTIGLSAFIYAQPSVIYDDNGRVAELSDSDGKLTLFTYEQGVILAKSVDDNGQIFELRLSESQLQDLIEEKMAQ